MKFWFLLSLFCFSALAADFELAIPSDEATLTDLRKELADKGEYVDRRAKRLGNKTLEVDCYLSFAGDFPRFREIASDFAAWGDWLLRDINTPAPTEGEYLLQLHDLQESVPKKMTTVFSFNIPFFKNHRTRSFDLKSESSEKSYLVVGDSIPSEKSAVKQARAFLKAFPAEKKPGFLWVNVRAMVLFKSWFLYEALPEKVLLREVGDRLTYIAQNYQREEARRIQGTKAEKRVSASLPDNE